MDGNTKPQLYTEEQNQARPRGDDDDDEPFLFEVFDAVSSVVVPVASMVDAAADTVLQASLEVVMDPEDAAGVTGQRVDVFDDGNSSYADGGDPDELDPSEQAAAVSKFWSLISDADDPQSAVSSHWARGEAGNDSGANSAAEVYGASYSGSGSSRNNSSGGVGESKDNHDRNDDVERGGSEEYEIEPANIVDALTNRVVYQEGTPQTPPPSAMDSLAIAEAEAETARREAWAAKRGELGGNGNVREGAGQQAGKTPASSGISAGALLKERSASPQGGGSGGSGGSRKEHALVREGLCTANEVEAAREAFNAASDLKSFKPNANGTASPAEQLLSQSACLDLLRKLTHSRGDSSSSNNGGEARVFALPSDKDLQAAFLLADVNSCGSVRACVLSISPSLPLKV